MLIARWKCGLFSVEQRFKLPTVRKRGKWMTDREKAIVMAYTGICMLTGDKFQIFHKYVEDIMGRPIWTHEMGIESIADEIKAKSKDDFIALCADESSTEKPKSEKVLDKIRAEIEQEYKAESEHPYGQGLRRAIEIIDKN